MKLIHKHDEEIGKIDNLMRELENSPAVRMFRQEQEAKRLAERKEQAEQIKSLEAERESLSGMRQEIQKIQDDLKKKDAERMSLLSEFSKKKSAYAGKSQSIESQIGRLKGELMESCDPRIREATLFFKGRLQWLRTPGRISSQNVEGERNIITDKIHTKVESNLRAVKKALVYCQESLKQLETMKEDPELDVAGIESLKAGIPDCNVYSEIEGERSLSSKVPGSLIRLASENELTWRAGKIMERAKKILKR